MAAGAVIAVLVVLTMSIVGVALLAGALVASLVVSVLARASAVPRARSSDSTLEAVRDADGSYRIDTDTLSKPKTPRPTQK